MKIVSIISTLLISFSFISFSQTVTIGTQVWMDKNLDVSTFRNGDPIPEVKTIEEWVKAGENKQPAWCYYENDPVNGTKYGKLYNWHAVNDPRGLAPLGYHIPTSAEWTILIDFLGGKSIAGKKLKSTKSYDRYKGKKDNSTNEFGFSALPGGGRNEIGTFYDIGVDSDWWSSTEDDVDFFEDPKQNHLSAMNFGVISTYDDVIPDQINKFRGLSVRCVKD
jgi:uncharacterized protein (TIGR02145 family)